MRAGWLVAMVLALSVGVLTARPAAAQKAEGPAHGQGHVQGAAGPGGEPAHDEGVFGWALDLAIWTIVVFGLLYVVLRYVKLPGAPAPAFVLMLEGLQKREQNIHAAMEEARRARDESLRLREQLQREMDAVGDKVRTILEDARRDAERANSEMTAKARAEMAAERERLRREIETARDQALQQLWNQSAELAMLISAKAIQRQLSTDDHRRLADEALAEIRAAGDGFRQMQT
jgi:F-type H+-transporting ATPase subunit b